MIILLFSWLAIGTTALGVTFHGVPENCQKALLDIYSQRDSQNIVIDWRPWAAHLKKIGYPDDHLPRLMDASADVPSYLKIIRRAIEDENWKWRNGLTADQSAQVSSRLSFPVEFLEHIEGFDIARAVLASLIPAIDEPVLITEEQIRWLARRLPFWGHLPHVSDILKFIVKYTENENDRVQAARWISRYLSERGEHLDPIPSIPSDVKHATWLNQERMFMAMGDEHLLQATAEERSNFEKDWRFSSNFPAVVDDHIETFVFGLAPAGECPEMSFNFLQFLIKPVKGEYFDQPIPQTPLIVRLNGKLVGLIKGDRDGDYSMLALRNVENRSGSVRLAMGGVYQVPKSLGKPPESNAHEGKWPILDVADLRVRSLAPLLNDQAWDIKNLPIILEFLPGWKAHQAFWFAVEARRELNERVNLEITRLQVLRPHRMIRKLAWDESFSFESWWSARQRLHRHVWPVILKRIDELRRQIEKQAS